MPPTRTVAWRRFLPLRRDETPSPLSRGSTLHYEMGKKTKSVTKAKQKDRKKVVPTDSSTLVIKSEEHLQQWIDKANVNMHLGDMEGAIKIYDAISQMYRSVIQMDEANMAATEEEKIRKRISWAKIKCSTGEAYVSMGLLDRGREQFREGIGILSVAIARTITEEALEEESHDVLAGLYMYLGQSTTEDGKEALQWYNKGVEELNLSLNILMKRTSQEATMIDDDAVSSETSPLEEMILETKNRLCGAYCAMAELYLTDLCFELNAEAQCEAALQRALQLDPSSPEPFQLLANLRLVQSRGEEATTYILDAYGRIEAGCIALASLVGFGIDDGLATELNSSEQEAADRLPGFDFRIQTAKLLLECANACVSLNNENDTNMKDEEDIGNKCAEAAIQVLGSLMAENDEVIEVWFLIGCAAMASNPSNSDMAIYHWTKAIEMLSKIKESLEEKIRVGNGNTEGGSANIQEELDAIQAQIEEIKEKQQGFIHEEVETSMS